MNACSLAASLTPERGALHGALTPCARSVSAALSIWAAAVLLSYVPLPAAAQGGAESGGSPRPPASRTYGTARPPGSPAASGAPPPPPPPGAMIPPSGAPRPPYPPPPGVVTSRPVYPSYPPPPGYYRPPPPRPNVGIVVGPVWPRPWGYPYSPGYPYAYPGWGYPSYPSTVVVTPPAVVATPPVVTYVERSEQAAVEAPAAGFWYWCAEPSGWYPQIAECPGGWQPVAPRSEQ
jgi:hypothetical protein